MDYKLWCLPILGEYDTYGRLENIVRDDNVEHIERYLGIPIEEFLEFLDKDRRCEESIIDKLKENDVFKEVEDVSFMWIHQKVYDYMTTAIDTYFLGKHIFGNAGILKELGFKFVKEDPNLIRYKYVYSHSDTLFYSDGTWLNSENKTSIFAIETLEKFIKIPNKAKYLKKTTRYDVWRLHPEVIIEEFKTLFFERSELMDYELSQLKARLLNEKVPPYNIKSITTEYFNNINIYGDRLAKLIHLRMNLYAFSKTLTPYLYYVTPQFGEYETHGKILKKFLQINNEYLKDEV